MEELYKTIEKKIKASGYPRKISGEEFTMTSAIRSMGKRTEAMCCFPSLMMM